MRAWKKGLLVGGSILLFVGSVPATSGPYPEDFVRDVDEIVRLIEAYHPTPFRRVTRAAWMREGAAIKEAARGGAAAAPLAVRMMAWVASLGDGHTNLEPEGIEAFDRWYPIRFHEFADGLYITGATGAGVPLNGSHVLEIGGVAAEEAAARQARLQGADNEFGAREERYLLSNAGIVEALELAAPGGVLELLVESDGVVEEVSVRAVAAPFSFGWRFSGEMYGPPLAGHGSWREWKAAFDGADVESYRIPDPDRPPHLQYRLPYRFTRLGPDDRTFYFAFNFTQNWRDESLAEFVSRLFTEIRHTPDARLIIDLRYNSGGDGSLILPIVHGIIRTPELDVPQSLFVLTGPKTFSAAVMLVGELAKHTRATFVGSPPGAPLNSYGDARDFVLPGTNMRLYVSTLYHQYARSDDDGRVFPVDVPAPMTGKEYFAGDDPALDAILGDEDTRPIDVIAPADGADSARIIAEARTEEARALGWDEWRPFAEEGLKYIGYEELLQGRVASAVSFLSMVAKVYPDSWDAHDRLAQALEAAERTEEAITMFRRSLKLNPDNTPGREALERLTAGADAHD